MARIIVADDASGPEHLAALRAIEGIEVVAGEQNARLRRERQPRAGRDLPGPRRGAAQLGHGGAAGLAGGLQYATSRGDDIGIVGARLLYPDGRIQFAGTVRNRGAPEWFDHRYRFKPGGWGPARLPGPVLAVTGACMYLTRAMLDRVGPLDERYPMAYEDVDWCLRAWQAGFRVMYYPAAVLDHHESVTRGTELGERELASQRLFWERWGDFFDARNVQDRGRAAADRLRHRGHGRRRRAPRHLRAPQPTRRARPRGRAVLARGAARLVRPARAGAQLRGLRGSRRGARAARRDQGRDLVEHGCVGVARERAARASPSTSCRTSRRATTPTTSTRATRCSTPTVPSSAT